MTQLKIIPYGFHGLLREVGDSYHIQFIFQWESMGLKIMAVFHYKMLPQFIAVSK